MTDKKILQNRSLFKLRKSHHGGYELGHFCRLEQSWFWRALVTQRRGPKLEREAGRVGAEMLEDAACRAESRADNFVRIAASMRTEALTALAITMDHK
jgi:hypothetical protein